MSREAAIRISELARTAGVPLATVKFYLREGLLHPGRATAATQAEYDDGHVARLRLVRALVQVGGLSVAATREVVASLERAPTSMHEVMGAAHAALPPRAPAGVDPRRSRDLVARLGWRIHPDTAALGQLEQALTALEEVGLPAPDDRLEVYADAARRVAEVDVAGVPTTSAEEAATTVVVGTVLYEPVLLALRRLAQQAVSADRYGREAPHTADF